MNEIFENQRGRTNCFYCYNEKSGLTLSLLQILEQRRERNHIRYFHFNSEYIEKYKKKYFYIQGILTEIIKEFNDIYIIFDNIKKMIFSTK